MPSKYQLQDYIAASLYLADLPVTARNLGIYLDLPLEIVHQNIQDLKAHTRSSGGSDPVVGVFAQSEQNQDIPIANLLGRAISGLVDFARTGRTPDLLVSLAGPELVAYKWMVEGDAFVFEIETSNDTNKEQYGLKSDLDRLVSDLNAISESQNERLAALNESFAESRRLRSDPDGLTEAERQRENALKNEIIDQEWKAFETRTAFIRHLILYTLARALALNFSLFDAQQMRALSPYLPKIRRDLPLADRYLALATAIGSSVDDRLCAELLQVPVAEIVTARETCQLSHHFFVRKIMQFVGDEDEGIYRLSLHADLLAEFAGWQDQRIQRAQAMLKEKLQMRSYALKQLVAAIQERCASLEQVDEAVIDLLQSELPDLEGALKEDSMLMDSLEYKSRSNSANSKDRDLVSARQNAIDGVMADFASLIDLHEQQIQANKRRLTEARLIDEAGLARSIEDKLALLLQKTQALKKESEDLHEILVEVKGKIDSMAHDVCALSIAGAPAVQCHLAMNLSRAFFEQTNAYKSLSDLREIASRKVFKK